ncbi:MAG: SdrD B-like domain-containing protein [Blastocatellia bacterium]
MKPRLLISLLLLVAGASVAGWWWTSTTHGQLVQDITYDSPAGRFTIPTKPGVADGNYSLAELAYYTPSNVINVGSLAGDSGNGFSDRYDFENLNAFSLTQSANEVGDRDSLNPLNQVLIGGMLRNPGFRFVHIGTYPYVWRTGSATDQTQTREVTVFTSIDHVFDPEIPGYGPNGANPPPGGIGNVVLEACEFTVWGTNDIAEAEIAGRTPNYFGIGGTGVAPNNKWTQATLKYLIEDGYKDFNGVSPFTPQPAGTSPSPQEGEDFSSQWEFQTPVKYVAVYANRTRDAKFYVPDANGRVPGTLAQSDEAEIDAVGFIPFAAPVAGRIGGRVIHDRNGNGQVDAGEVGLPGVTVTLVNPGGGQVPTVTNQDGEFSFPQLPAGDYRVIQTNLPNYVDTGILPGNGNTASGLNTILIPLTQGRVTEDNLFLDALPTPPTVNNGCTPACFYSIDTWFLFDVLRQQVYTRIGGVGRIFLLTANRGALNDAEVVDALLAMDTPAQRLNAQYVAAQLNTFNYPLSIYNRATCFYNGPNNMVRIPGNPRVIDLLNQARTEFATAAPRTLDQLAVYLEWINNITATTGIFCPLADP